MCFNIQWGFAVWPGPKVGSVTSEMAFKMRDPAATMIRCAFTLESSNTPLLVFVYLLGSFYPKHTGEENKQDYALVLVEVLVVEVVLVVVVVVMLYLLIDKETKWELKLFLFCLIEIFWQIRIKP